MNVRELTKQGRGRGGIIARPCKLESIEHGNQCTIERDARACAEGSSYSSMHDVDNLKHSSTHAHTHAHKGWRNCTLPARMCERLACTHSASAWRHVHTMHAVGSTPACICMHKFNDVITHDGAGVLLTESVCVPRSETLLDSVVLV